MLEVYLPEGRLLHTSENQRACASLEGLRSAKASGRILEGQVLLCDAQHNLLVQVGNYTSLMPREEVALGVAEGTVREIAILSRVGKPVAFVVEGVEESEGIVQLSISRRAAQARAQAHLMECSQIGQVIPATITHLESFGAFVDVGCGLVSMIGIERISVSRIPHPNCRFTIGQEVYALIQEVDNRQKRLRLSHRELLGTWLENAQTLTPGMTVTGYVRGVQSYGIFVELSPNLSGLAEPKEGLQDGDRVSVYIKSILPQKRKIKLLVLEKLSGMTEPSPFRYYTTEGVVEEWAYNN